MKGEFVYYWNSFAKMAQTVNIKGKKCIFLHLDCLIHLGAFLKSRSWWMGNSEQPSNTSAFSACSATVGLNVFFLLSLKRGSQRPQAAFSKVLVWMSVYVGGWSKGHSECISGLSCAMCQGDSAERNHKKGSAEAPALHVPQRRQIPPQGLFTGFTSETREP